MRIDTVTVRNYRLHRELRIEFDARRTVVGGPNESGKSTLVEAIRRAFFLKYRATGDVREEMLSHFDSGHPEVDVDFTIGERRFSLQKRFSGATGSCSLREYGGATLNGDAAEERLASLLGSGELKSGRGASDRVQRMWGHLWVTQGTAGNDPVESANDQHDSLLRHLQALGGGALAQSPEDGRVAREVGRRFASIWTERGEHRRSSEPANAKVILDAATSRRQNAEARRDELEHSIRSLDEADAILATSELASQQGEREELRQQSAQLERIEQRIAVEEKAIAEAHAQFEGVRGRIRELEDQEAELRQLRIAAEPLRTAETQFEALMEERSRRAREAQEGVREAHDRTSRLRQREDLLRTHRELLLTEVERGQLRERCALLESMHVRRTALTTRIAALRSIDEAALDRLRVAEQLCATTRTRLDAMAAGFELIEGDGPVTVDDRSVKPGDHLILIGETEIRIGESTRMRIFPGGGTALVDVRREADDAAADMRDLLFDLRVTSLAEAKDEFVTRSTLLQEERQCQQQIDQLDADRVAARLREADERFASLVGRRSQFIGSEDADSLPSSLGEASVAADEGEAAYQRAVSAEQSAIALHASQSSLAEEARLSLDASRVRCHSVDQAISALQGSVAALTQHLGDAGARACALEEAERRYDATQSVHVKSLAERAPLRAADIEANLVRLTRVIDNEEARQQRARDQRTASLTRLTLDGSTDPNEAIATAQADESRARARWEVEQRRAQALRHLNQLFSYEQQRLATLYTEPLAESASGYLRALFGEGTRMDIQVTPDGFRGITLARADASDAAFEFHALSGGAKEQVAVAFRLAMAEVLARDHFGTLPLILDDAFAYSDPARVRTVQRMLDRAAAQGLQIIVMTCNPADYVGFGARSVQLAPPSPGRVRTQRVAVDGPETSVDSDQPILDVTTEPTRDEDADSKQRFLSVLREHGGSMSNPALRTSLRWGSDQYLRIKSALLLDRTIQTGAGRGGTVRLT